MPPKRKSARGAFTKNIFGRNIYNLMSRPISATGSAVRNGLAQFLDLLDGQPRNQSFKIVPIQR